VTIVVKEFQAESAGPPATREEGLVRLENLAVLLEAAHARYTALKQFYDDNSDDFDANGDPLQVAGYYQGRIGHPCGTPACAIGHYAYEGNTGRFGWTKDGEAHSARDFPAHLFKQIEHEFCLGTYEVDVIFGGAGCDNAQTAGEAAEFIRQFIEDKRSGIDPE
jgi:hypothetical protein